MIPKFRVWLTDIDQMLRVKALVFEKDKTRCFCGYSFDFYLEDENATIMQSTGLKDKNGREIFEGDILACKTDDEVINLNIFWDEEHALFMFESKKYNEQEPLAELVEDNTYPFGIIGNIYENRELLEDKK
nr:MAG TPA: YopX protein [Caudoviricetes sp.]